MPVAPLERRVHGRERDPARPDELHFGPFRRMLRASLVAPRTGAQWTGIATRLAERLLEPARERGYRRLAIVGIPCQVYALRALEADLGFERLYVIGTPCSDNTTTENFHRFLALLDERPETIAYLEFRADYHVDLHFDDGRVREIQFLQLPVSKLPRDFFPLTCRTCVDYTNVLADVTVGYMGGEGEQWLLVRNERAAGGLPLRGTPRWLRPVVGWLMPRVGPRE